MTEIKMSNTVKFCYLIYFRGESVSKIWSNCDCEVCNFKRLYEVKKKI